MGGFDPVSGDGIVAVVSVWLLQFWLAIRLAGIEQRLQALADSNMPRVRVRKQLVTDADNEDLG